AAGGFAAYRTFGRSSVEGTAASSSSPAIPEGVGPQLLVPDAIAASVPGFVSTLRGLVDGAVAMTADGAPVTIEPGGQFRMYIPQGLTEIRLTATDEVGRVTEAVVAVTDSPPPPAYPATAAVHVRASDWGDPVVREQVIELARTGQINAVQLDIKDEAGEVGYATAVPMAATVGSAAGYYDAAEALAELHALDVRVIGRIVCFLDPLMSKWAWENGRPDLIVLDGAGQAPLDNNYGSAAFSNLGSAEVRQYQLDLAVEAVGLGFDDILYDYIRRPEGDLAAMQFPGLDTPPEVAVARFVAETKANLDTGEAMLGVSVFGISATRPEPTAQDIGLLAPNVDYVAPMVYPSHWGSGEYGVADPNRQPADIVGRSLADFERIVAGSGAAVVPWLQDFSEGGVTYTAAEVRAQIDAAAAAGAEGFLLWNPHSQYSTDALDPAPG
ncbi:MAG: hypothetical protein H0W46_11450, partial [Acidimicrobiia bacterium]|nr:hypothetical protein [Acidimicrobiia bacterium]